MENEFDFDYWASLAETDPQAFERQRAAVIEEVIASRPAQYQQRLRQLQWKIDTVRQLSPNPLASCLRIYDLLMDMTYGEGGLLDSLNALADCESPGRQDAQLKENGRLLEFKRRKKKTGS